MADKKIQRPVFDNPFLNIIVNPDGTVIRKPFPQNPAISDPSSNSPVLSKDVILDPMKRTWNRIYIPNMDTPPIKKLPLIMYYHGGGFVFFNADTYLFDNFCKGIVEKVGAVVVSLEYRLTPEHRLPAAYDDAVDGFRWVKTAEDDWLRDYADFNNCYLCGTSAGGNLAYQAGLRFIADPSGFGPIKINGMILHHPYFSGTKRTESEEKLAHDQLLPLYAILQMFDLSLPEGADYDHEYCNPSTALDKVDGIKKLGWRALVTGCFDDPLVDACLDCAKMFEGKGVETVRFFSDGYHAMEVFDPSMAGPLFESIKDFII